MFKTGILQGSSVVQLLLGEMDFLWMYCSVKIFWWQRLSAV